MIEYKLDTNNIQILNFYITTDVLSPSELSKIPSESPAIDAKKPLILSGRGPQWLYAALTHHYHYTRILATYEPRTGKGIIVEALDSDLIGKAIDPDTGEIFNIKLGVGGELEIDFIKLGDVQIINVYTEKDRYVEPSLLKIQDLEEIRDSIDQSIPIILNILAPIYVGARIAALYSNLTPAFIVYDSRIKGGVVVASHTKEYSLGDIVYIKLWKD